jgi:hypothetical protein
MGFLQFSFEDEFQGWPADPLEGNPAYGIAAIFCEFSQVVRRIAYDWNDSLRWKGRRNDWQDYGACQSVGSNS